MGTPLRQQELLVPDPPRRLIVRPGMTAHWGIDPSTQRIAVAWNVDGKAGVQMRPFPRTDGLARLSDIRQGTRDFAEDLLMQWPTPGFVFVEQPSGQNVDPILWYAVGVIIEAIQDVVEGARVETISPSSWKKVACGRGNLYKPKKGDDWEYGVLTWARLNGYAGSSYDEADALGIAEAARRLVTLESR